MSSLPQLVGFSEQNGQWFVENVSLSSIANEFGTPCYVYSKKALTTSFSAYDKACFRKDGSRRARIHYAMKANGNLAILNIFSKLGTGFDLVSGGELTRVLAAGGKASDCVFSGVGKSRSEIILALNAGVKCFNVESIPELERINEIACSLQTMAPISLRVNPDVDAKTHPYISTGLKDNKFGISFGEIIKTYQVAQQMQNIQIVGIDCHIGSQILDISPFLDALDRVLALITELDSLGIPIHHLDIGGGLGIDYGGDTPPDITFFANTLLDHIESKGFNHLEVIFEPGRSLVGNAGVLLTLVEYLKPGETKNFCIVDAAMNDLMRPSMYEAFHAIVPIQSINSEPSIYDVVGPVCETGDWLGRDRSLAVQPGDILAILSAGAYGFSMSSNYNARPRAAEVLVDDINTYVVRDRETFDQLLQGERII
jgi:diaminopimelate decarboxylase